MSYKQPQQVATDALQTLGMIIDETAGRDAIHLAVEPIVAGEKLFPGQHISIKDGVAVSTGETFGIVDPFLKGPVQQGQRFWFVIYPRQITSLRHVWEHPRFAPLEKERVVEVEKEVEKIVYVPKPGPWDEDGDSERWIRNYCDQLGERYEYIMSEVDEVVRTGGGHYIYGEHDRGKFEGEGSMTDEFWEHYENVRGVRVSSSVKGLSYFTCSC